MSKKKIIVISDVDGCLTNGSFIYTVDGKVAKTFGPHDNDGVKLLQANGVDVEFISADKRGFDITKKRIDDMKCKLTLVSESERADYIGKYLDEYETVVFFGDGIGDAAVVVKYPDVKFICPRNARPEAIRHAVSMCMHVGGDGAFYDCALNVLHLYIPYEEHVGLYGMIPIEPLKPQDPYGNPNEQQ